jgi:hypothetical protein
MRKYNIQNLTDRSKPLMWGGQGFKSLKAFCDHHEVKPGGVAHYVKYGIPWRGHEIKYL